MSSSEEDDVVVEFEDEEEKEVESDEGDGEGVDSDEDGEEEIDRVEVESECDQSQEQDDDQVSKKKKKKKITPGVVYLSRIPPFMRPCKVRHLLSQCGNIGRIYLQPEGNDINIPLHHFIDLLHHFRSTHLQEKEKV